VALFRNIKIRAKLFFGFFLLLAITIFIALFGVRNINTINANYTLMLDFPVERYNMINYMYAEIIDLRRINAAASFNLGDTSAIDALRTIASQRMSTLEVLLSDYMDSNQADALMDPERQAYMLARAHELGSFILRFHTEVISEMLAAAEVGIVGDPASRTAVGSLLDRGAGLFEEMEEVFFVLQDGAQTTMANRYEEIHNLADASVAVMFGVTLAGVVLGLVIALLISGMVTRPITRLSSALGDVAGGDLTKRLPAEGKDELAQASRSYNQSMEEFGKMIASIKNQSIALNDIGNDLASNMTETASAMNEIAANIQSIKARVLNQSASVAQTNSTMGQVSANIGRLGGHVESQSAAVTQSSAAVEEMIANIQSVSGTLAKNASNVKELQDSSDTGRVSLNEVASDIQEIARESEGLMEINSVMENIASQTNLLSMNAAIEAAHAGEAGRGFAVVAAEIRKLAESSGDQSKTIGNVLKKIKGSIDKISRSTNKVLAGFEAIDQSVKTVAEQEENIRNAMDEQNEGSKQILQASGEVNNITQQVRTGSEEMLAGSKEVIAEAKNLEKVTQEITQGMNEMAVGAEQVNQAVFVVNELTSKTKENISALAQSVSRFKV